MNSIESIIRSLQSSRRRERTSGQEQLEHFLVDPGNVYDLVDTKLNALFRALSEAISADRRLYLQDADKDADSIPQSPAASRLNYGGVVLRKLIEATFRGSKVKTRRLILSIIMELLPSANGGVCKPLMAPFTVILLLLCGQETTLDHLQPLELLGLVDFCSQQALEMAKEVERAHGRSYAVHRSQRVPQAVVDVMECLDRLLRRTVPSNLDTHKLVYQRLSQFLSCISEESSSHGLVFSCFSTILRLALLEDLGFTHDVAMRGIEAISSLGSIRDSGFKTQISLFILHAYRPLKHLSTIGPSANSTKSTADSTAWEPSLQSSYNLASHLQKLKSSLLESNEETIKVTDCTFGDVFEAATANTYYDNPSSPWLVFPCFRAADSADKRPWYCAIAISRIVRLLEVFVPDSISGIDGEQSFVIGEPPNSGSERSKRIRTSANPLSMGTFSRGLWSAEAQYSRWLSTAHHLSIDRILQSLCLWCQTDQVIDSCALLEELIGLVKDFNRPITVFWSLLCCGALLRSTSAVPPPRLVDSLWKLSMQHLHDKASGVASSFCIDTLLRLGIVDAPRHFVNIDSLMKQFDYQSPYICTTSLSLARTLSCVAAEWPRLHDLSKQKLPKWLHGSWKSYILAVSRNDPELLSPVDISMTLLTFSGIFPESHPSLPLLYCGNICEGIYEARSEAEWTYLSGIATTVKTPFLQTRSIAFVTPIGGSLIDSCCEMIRSVMSLDDERDNRWRVLLHVAVVCTVVDSLASNGTSSDDSRVALSRDLYDLVAVLEEFRPSSMFSDILSPLLQSAEVIWQLKDHIKDEKAANNVRNLSSCLKDLMATTRFVNDLEYGLPHSIDALQFSRQAQGPRSEAMMELLPRLNDAEEISNFITDLDMSLESMIVSLPSILPFLRHLDFGYMEEANMIYHTILRDVGTNLLASSVWNLSEASVVLCSEALSVFVSSPWITYLPTSTIRDINEVFDWLVKAILDGPVVSPKARTSLLRLLASIPVPSDARLLKTAREAFLRLCEGGGNSFIFACANEFGRFRWITSAYEGSTLYEDVKAHLGSCDTIENLALRCYFYSACESEHTSVVCRILDLIQASRGNSDHARFARIGVSRISSKLKLQQTGDLLNGTSDEVVSGLIRRQIDVREFPFELFEISEVDFFQDNLDTVCAAYLGKSDEQGLAMMEYAHDLLNISKPDILYRVFAKSVAYRFGATKELNGFDEAMFKSYFGKRKFDSFVNQHLAEIVCELLALTDVSSFSPSFSHASGLESLNSVCGVTVPCESSQITVEQFLYAVKSLFELCPALKGRVWTEGALTLTTRRVLDVDYTFKSASEKVMALRRSILLLEISQDQPTHGYPLELVIRVAAVLSVESSIELEASAVVRALVPLLDSSAIETALCGLLEPFLETLPISGLMKDVLERTLAIDGGPLSRSLVGIAASFAVNGTERFSDDNIVQLFQHLPPASSRLPAKFRICLSVLSHELETAPSYRDELLRSVKGKLLVDVAEKLPRLCQNLSMSNGFQVWAGRVVARAYCHQLQKFRSTESFLVERFNARVLQEAKGHSQAEWFTTDPAFAGILESVSGVIAGGTFRELGYAEQCIRVFQYKTPLDRRALLSILPAKFLAATLHPIHFSRPGVSELHLNPPTSATADFWSASVCLSLLKYLEVFSEHLNGLEDLIKKSPGFAKEVFPYLVQSVLSLRGEASDKQKLLTLLYEHSRHTNSDATVVKLLIETILYLRVFKLVGNSTSGRISIKWGELAVSAKRIENFKSSLLLLELQWSSNDDYDRELLSDLCGGIKDPDLFYGTKHRPSLDVAVRNLAREGDTWSSLTYESALYDSSGALGAADKTFAMNLSDSLLSVGMYGLARSVTETSASQAEGSESAYCWRLEQWDLAGSDNLQSKDDLLYYLFKHLNASESLSSSSANIAFERVYSSAWKRLLESNQRDDFVHALVGVRETEELASVKDFGHCQLVLSSQKERVQEWIDYEDFGGFSDLLLARHVGWSTLSKKASGSLHIETLSALAGSLRTSCGLAIGARHAQKSMTFAIKLQQLAKQVGSYTESERYPIEVLSEIESAAVIWMAGDQSSSIEMLKSVASRPEFVKGSALFSCSEVFATLAQWSATAKHEPDEYIRENYLEKAVELLKHLPQSAESNADTYHAFAAFCDSRLSSATLSESISYAERSRNFKKNEVQELEKLVKSPRGKDDARRATKELSAAVKVFAADDREYQGLLKRRQQYLKHSIRYYLKAICASDKTFRGDASRFCALWLAHSEEAVVSSTVARYAGIVPTIRLVPWINQLSSRLMNSKDAFQASLRVVIARICEDHPFHSLYQLIGLMFVPEGETDRQTVARSAAGRGMWDQISKRKKIKPELLHSIESLSTRVVSLAFVGVKNRKQFSFSQLKQDDKEWWLKTLPSLQIPWPTADIKLRADGRYTEGTVPAIRSIKQDISIASGLSRPKILVISDTSGRTFSSLLKSGNDDLRQDAIMEQVFDQVNEFFMANKRAKMRQLRVRTYKVIPFGPTAGMIEFVSDTIPLMEALTPLHKNYYPDDMDVSVARRKMDECRQLPVHDRVVAYESIETQVHPVLRHYFFERFFSPDVWFENRTRYSRSTAVISILGHILGLGDRHCNNILLDKQTGEVVHIDLGIAFDQGKLLAVPESVPFRLTRDVVDGMGICGVEGVFRRCCEVTMGVLRKEIDGITTILNVLRYDPLYSWTISQMKRQKVQGEAQGEKTVLLEPEVGSEAERALTVAKQKLSDRLSIEAAVRELIQEATSRRNLAVLYMGWCPFF